MGNEFEVYAWEKIGENKYVVLNELKDEYEWVQKYAGNNYYEAIEVMEAFKIQGVGLVKLEWR